MAISGDKNRLRTLKPTERPSMLHRGSPGPASDSGGLSSPSPWFQDREKLLRAVLAHAEVDRQFARHVASEVGELARSQPGLRKTLRMASAGGRRGAPRTADATLAQIADTFLMLRDSMPRGARARVLSWIETSPGFAPGSASGAADLLDRALAAFPRGSAHQPE